MEVGQIPQPINKKIRTMVTILLRHSSHLLQVELAVEIPISIFQMVVGSAHNARIITFVAGRNAIGVRN